eukprot:2687794-Heterocapsa_arctica.AAC.1
MASLLLAPRHVLRKGTLASAHNHTWLNSGWMYVLGTLFQSSEGAAIGEWQAVPAVHPFSPPALLLYTPSLLLALPSTRAQDRHRVPD